MKKILRTASVLSLFLSLSLIHTSCGGFLGIEITDQSSIDSYLRSKIGEIIGNDTKVAEISLSMGGGGTFSTTISYASVHYFDPQTDELKCSWITLSGKLEGKDKSVSSKFINDDDNKVKIKSEDAQKLSDIDLSKIAANINKAGEIVEAGENEASGVGSYDIIVNTDPAKVKHMFSIESRQGSKTVSTSRGLGTEVSYLTFDFTADSEGNVTAKE